MFYVLMAKTQSSIALWRLFSTFILWADQKLLISFVVFYTIKLLGWLDIMILKYIFNVSKNALLSWSLVSLKWWCLVILREKQILFVSKWVFDVLWGVVNHLFRCRFDAKLKKIQHVLLSASIDHFSCWCVLLIRWPPLKAYHIIYLSAGY